MFGSIPQGRFVNFQETACLTSMSFVKKKKAIDDLYTNYFIISILEDKLTTVSLKNVSNISKLIKTCSC